MTLRRNESTTTPNYVCKTCDSLWLNGRLTSKGKRTVGNAACQECGYEPTLDMPSVFHPDDFPF